MTENEIIIASKKDPKQFEPLYNKYYLPVFRFVYKRTVNTDLAGEVTSIVFVKVLENIKSYKVTDAKFSSWIFRIAYNTIQDKYRESKSSRTVNLTLESIPVITEQDNNKSIREEQLQKLLKLIPELSEEEITLLELRFFEQRKYKEVAEILNLTEENARVKIYRLINKIKKKLL